MQTVIKIKINQEIHFFDLTIEDVGYNWTIISPENIGIVLSGYILTEYGCSVGLWTSHTSIFFFKNMLLRKLKVELRKMGLKNVK